MDPVRSADPPTISGITAANAFNTSSDLSRDEKRDKGGWKEKMSDVKRGERREGMRSEEMKRGGTRRELRSETKQREG